MLTDVAGVDPVVVQACRETEGVAHFAVGALDRVMPELEEAHLAEVGVVDDTFAVVTGIAGMSRRRSASSHRSVVRVAMASATIV